MLFFGYRRPYLLLQAISNALRASERQGGSALRALAFGIERAIRSFNAFEALRGLRDLTRHREIIGLAPQDQSISPRTEREV